MIIVVFTLKCVVLGQILWMSPEHLLETSWFPDPTETSLHRQECGLKRLTASGTDGSHRASKPAPFFGPQTSGLFPDQRIGVRPARERFD